MKFLIYILPLFFISSIVNSQSKDEVVKKTILQYSAAKPLQYNTTYNLYKNAGAVAPYQSYKGVFIKNALQDVYIKIADTEFLSTKKAVAKINNAEKVILIAKPAPAIQQEYDIKKLLSLFGKGSIKDKKSYWEVELLAKPFTELPYSKLLLYIGKDYYIQKQVFYYSTAMDFSEDYKKPDINYPKLEILFSKPVFKPISESRFDISQYCTTLNKKIKLAAKYSNYELIDQR